MMLYRGICMSLVLVSLAAAAVSSRELSLLSSSTKSQGKRSPYYEPESSATNAGPETLYRHQLEPYKTQSPYSRTQGLVYQRSVPNAGHPQQNLAGRPPSHPQQYYQSSKYSSAPGPPPSGPVKYYPVKPHIEYNRPQIQHNVGKPETEISQHQKVQYTRPAYYPQPQSVSPHSYQNQPQQIHYPAQDSKQPPPQQSPKPLSPYQELAQKQYHEALNFQKSRLNDASTGFNHQEIPQYQNLQVVLQKQQSAPQQQVQQRPQYQQHQPQYQQHQPQYQQHQPQYQPQQDHEQQQSENIPNTADDFYTRYLEMVNKQGFIQAPVEGESYEPQQQYQYENQETEQSNLHENFASPGRYLASGQMLN